METLPNQPPTNNNTQRHTTTHNNTTHTTPHTTPHTPHTHHTHNTHTTHTTATTITTITTITTTTTTTTLLPPLLSPMAWPSCRGRGGGSVASQVPAGGGGVAAGWWRRLLACAERGSAPMPVGRVWTCVWMPSTGVYWILEGTRHTQRTRPTWFTASPGRYINTGQGWGGCTSGRLYESSSSSSPSSSSSRCLSFSSSTEWWLLQLLDRDRAHNTQLCRRPEIRHVQFLGGCRHASWCANDRIWSDSAENFGSAGAVHRRFGRPCDYAAMVSRNWCLRFS